jgi:hypothetical protein
MLAARAMSQAFRVHHLQTTCWSSIILRLSTSLMSPREHGESVRQFCPKATHDIRCLPGACPASSVDAVTGTFAVPCASRHYGIPRWTQGQVIDAV